VNTWAQIAFQKKSNIFDYDQCEKDRYEVSIEKYAFTYLFIQELLNSKIAWNLWLKQNLSLNIPFILSWRISSDNQGPFHCTQNHIFKWIIFDSFDLFNRYVNLLGLGCKKNYTLDIFWVYFLIWKFSEYKLLNVTFKNFWKIWQF